MLDHATTDFLATLAATGLPPVHELTPEEARAGGPTLAALYGPGPDMARVQDIAIAVGDGAAITARLLVPGPRARGTIVYYHGGGWVLGGDLDQFDTLGRELAARTGCAVVLVDYRLAPEHRFPTAVEDSWAALRWVAANRAAIAGGAVPLIVAGDSAGGNLAAVLARRAAATDLELALQVLVYPVTDCDLDRPSYLEPGNQLLLSRDAMAWFWGHYVPEPYRRTDPDASPLRAQSLAGVAPAVVITAEHDVLRDEGEAYARRLAEAGVAVEHRCFEGQMHLFFTLVGVLPGNAAGLDFVAGAIDRALTRDVDQPTAEPQAEHFDAVVVGAGFAGLYALQRLREQGLSVRVLEQGDGVGGTWYWNRYPGARCDIESIDYSYSFSEELEQEWEWSERYPAQPEILRYLNHVADRFDLRRDVELGTRVTRAEWEAAAGRWRLTTADGRRYSARHCIMASGCLSAVNRPDFEGLEEFAGEWYHTARWPQGGVDLTGRRVGLIGTGSTGIQLLPQLARQAAHVHVFQRTANFSMPAHNRELRPEELHAVKSAYRERRRLARESLSGVPRTHPSNAPNRSALEVSDPERRETFERGWAEGGISGILQAFNDINLNPDANALAAEFVRSKIRTTVKDPATAEALCPTTHPIGTKRICVDTGYYETYNRENVTLVDVRRTPIERITDRGIRTTDTEYELDVIVFATGFDAITGALLEIDIRGRDGVTLREKWSQGPQAYLGLATAGFPNLFLVTGPGSPSVLSNMVCSIEQHVDWIADCVAHLREHGHETIEATPEAEQAWSTHVGEVAQATLFPTANSWYVGANIPGKPRVFMPYLGGVGAYRARCDEVAAHGYAGFLHSSERVEAVA